VKARNRIGTFGFSARLKRTAYRGPHERFSMDGLFITLEGLEGAGKSTQAKLLADSISEAGYPVTLVREPGGTHIGEAIRGLLADPQYDDMSPLTEVFLFAASRTQLVEQVIRPKLGEGTIVICDRYFDATLAYQGFGRGVD